MGLSTVRILLPRTKTHPFLYFKNLKKGLFLALERTYTQILIQKELILLLFRIAKTAFPHKVLLGVRILLVPTVTHPEVGKQN
jgi:hypothetical protein